MTILGVVIELGLLVGLGVMIGVGLCPNQMAYYYVLLMGLCLVDISWS